MTYERQQKTAIVLYAFAGGFADASSLLSFNTFTGHVTGNIVFLAVSIAKRNWGQTGIRVFAIACFLLGTFAGSYLAKQKHNKIMLFALQATLLLSLVLLPHSALRPWFGVAAYCCALGLQNGVVTTTLGVSVHSTYLSGDISNLITLNRRARDARRTAAVAGEPSPDLKHEVLSRAVLGFAAGAFLAALLSSESAHSAPLLLLVPLALAMLAGKIADSAGNSDHEVN